MIRAVMLLASLLLGACAVAPNKMLSDISAAEAEVLAADTAHLLASRMPAAATTVSLYSPEIVVSDKSPPPARPPLVSAMDERLRLEGFGVAMNASSGVRVEASTLRLLDELLLLVRVDGELWSRIYSASIEGLKSASSFTIRESSYVARGE